MKYSRKQNNALISRKAVKTLRLISKPAPKEQTQEAQTKPNFLEFLKFPAEVRNRIYDYMHENPGTPPTVRRTTPSRKNHRYSTSSKPLENSGRRGLGLTQPCRQIRYEFRSQWLRETTVRLDANEVTSYADTFYCTKEGIYKNTPKLVLLSWDQNASYSETTYLNQKSDIGQALKLHADCSGLDIKFFHSHTYNINSGGICKLCRLPVHLDCFYGLPAMSERQREIVQAMLELNNFLAHDNEPWRKAIRNLIPHTMTVGWSGEPCWGIYEYIDPIITIQLKRDNTPEHLPKLDLDSSTDLARGRQFLIDHSMIDTQFLWNGWPGNDPYNPIEKTMRVPYPVEDKHLIRLLWPQKGFVPNSRWLIDFSPPKNTAFLFA